MIVRLEFPRKKSRMQDVKQIKHGTSYRIPLLRQPGLFSFTKNPHQTSDMANKPVAKHQRSDKSLKIKLSKNLRIALPTRMLFHFW